MKKGLIGILMVTVLSLVLVGCGGGGSSSSENAVTSTYHIEDQFGTAIVGVSFNYTDPYGKTHLTDPTDANGNLIVVSNKVGKYILNGGKYKGTGYPIDPKILFTNSETDIANNVKIAYFVVVNTKTGAVNITQNPSP